MNKSNSKEIEEVHLIDIIFYLIIMMNSIIMNRSIMNSIISIMIRSITLMYFNKNLK